MNFAAARSPRSWERCSTQPSGSLRLLSSGEPTKSMAGRCKRVCASAAGKHQMLQLGLILDLQGLELLDGLIRLGMREIGATNPFFQPFNVSVILIFIARARR